jgi:hypothetical protein
MRNKDEVLQKLEMMRANPYNMGPNSGGKYHTLINYCEFDSIPRTEFFHGHMERNLVLDIVYLFRDQLKASKSDVNWLWDILELLYKVDDNKAFKLRSVGWDDLREMTNAFYDNPESNCGKL